MEDTKSHDVIPEDTDDLVLLFLFILNFVISYEINFMGIFNPHTGQY